MKKVVFIIILFCVMGCQELTNVIGYSDPKYDPVSCVYRLSSPDISIKLAPGYRYVARYEGVENAGANVFTIKYLFTKEPKGDLHNGILLSSLTPIGNAYIKTASFPKDYILGQERMVNWFKKKEFQNQEFKAEILSAGYTAPEQAYSYAVMVPYGPKHNNIYYIEYFVDKKTTLKLIKKEYQENILSITENGEL